MYCVMETLDKFCAMSGQEMSHDKTSIMLSSNVNKTMQRKLEQISKFKCTKNFGRYLGVLLSGKHLKKMIPVHGRSSCDKVERMEE